ncbi:hypothetical protein ACU610_23500 [Geodermatophilus sp. URMC 61]|uniref:hypothetical protein n=1 Tax=Geodermatophilus sp. URMC 61 TaxID=3423411 RepID=UPI00406C5FE9
MSTGFRLARDVMWVHGERGGDGDHRPRGGPRREFQGLPAAVFLLAFAAGEAVVKHAAEHHGLVVGRDNPMGLGSHGLVEAFATKGVDLRARARVVPQPGNTTGVHRWVLLEGADLDAYLRDAYRVRNALAHTGVTTGLSLRSPYFLRQGRTELRSVTLMVAEGMLQAAQDVAHLALRSTGPGAVDDWEWVEPTRSRASRLPAGLRRHPDFPLPG